MRQLANKIPVGLIYSRLLIGLLLVGLSYYHAPYYGPVAVALLVVGVLTDVFDGIVARQLGISTQRLRRLGERARRRGMSAWLLEQVEKLCGRSREYAEAYSHPGGHRTSNMLDRAMRRMNRYFDRGQHLHGSLAACRLHCLHCRAWAILANYVPWHPAVARANEGWRCPAERLNRHRYHDDWLQNLLASASLGGCRR